MSNHLETAWNPKQNGLSCSVFHAVSLLQLPWRLITGHLPHLKKSLPVCPSISWAKSKIPLIQSGYCLYEF